MAGGIDATLKGEERVVVVGWVFFWKQKWMFGGDVMLFSRKWAWKKCRGKYMHFLSRHFSA